MPGGMGQIQHGPDPLHHTARGFGLGQPYRREQVAHGGGGDLIDGRVADRREGVGFKAR